MKIGLLNRTALISCIVCLTGCQTPTTREFEASYIELCLTAADILNLPSEKLIDDGFFTSEMKFWEGTYVTEVAISPIPESQDDFGIYTLSILDYCRHSLGLGIERYDWEENEAMNAISDRLADSAKFNQLLEE